jgi:Beta-propeller repeat
VDSGGNIVLTGALIGSVNFGGGVLPMTGTYDVFVAKFTGLGTHVWSKRFPGSYDDYGRGVAVDGSGNVIVTGYFPGTINFGGETLSNLGGAFSPDGFLIQLAP